MYLEKYSRILLNRTNPPHIRISKETYRHIELISVKLLEKLIITYGQSRDFELTIRRVMNGELLDNSLKEYNKYFTNQRKILIPTDITITVANINRNPNILNIINNTPNFEKISKFIIGCIRIYNIRNIAYI